MRIAFITAGAAGMFCGSCMRDNTLVAALVEQGHDAILIPTYMPIRTDEVDVSEGRIFYGGINVYLQEKSWLFRIAPRFVDWLLNRPMLLRFVSRKARNVDYADFADLTVSMLRGADGRQRKELDKLVAWLKTEAKPDVVILTNALLSGLAPAIKKQLGVPVVTTLQGDDIFLDALPAKARKRCIDEIRRNDVATDGYICTSKFYADSMAKYLGIDRRKMDIVYPGINLKGHDGTIRDRTSVVPTVGFFARICPEKGFHNVVDAFILLRSNSTGLKAKLRVSGWLGEQNRPYYHQQVEKLKTAGLLEDFEHVDSPDHASKVQFFQSIDVLSVPTNYHEPKGLYILEAWANCVPVVQPRHGSFPELIETTGGGLLFEPGNLADCVDKLLQLLTDSTMRRELGAKGHIGTHQHYTARVMANETVRSLKRYVGVSSPEVAIF